MASPRAIALDGWLATVTFLIETGRGVAEQDADEDDSDSAFPKAKEHEATKNAVLHAQILNGKNGEAIKQLIFKIDETRSDSGLQMYGNCSNEVIRRL